MGSMGVTALTAPTGFTVVTAPTAPTGFTVVTALNLLTAPKITSIPDFFKFH